MLINEMHHRFEQEIDRISSQDRPDFLPNEIDDYLNKAIWIFLKDRYGVLNRSRQGFESNQERVDNLRNLHIRSPHVQPAIPLVELGEPGSGRYEARLNDLDFRYLFLTDATVTIEKNGCSKKIGHKQWQVDDVKTIYSDSSFEWNRILANFGRTSDPLATDNEDLGSIFFYTKDKYGVKQFDAIDVCISYIKYPVEVFFGTYTHINQNPLYVPGSQFHCDIDEAFHEEIVSIAAQQAQKDIQDAAGYQLQSAKVQLDQ